jgi:hypothetical protein
MGEEDESDATPPESADRYDHCSREKKTTATKKHNQQDRCNKSKSGGIRKKTRHTTTLERKQSSRG